MMILRALALMVTATTVLAGAAPPASARSTAVDWQPCAAAGKDDPVRCATLDLPIDWAAPAGERLGLSIARRPATDPAARIGTLVFGPGGPGDSGVNLLIRN